MVERTVFIVGGGGMVGATAAQAIAAKELVNEIVMIDTAEDLVRGQAMDISHGTAYSHGVNVRVGDYSEITKDDIVILTCGTPQKPGQSRRELLAVNADIMSDVVAKVMRQGKPVYLLVVANPVDVLTHVALRASGLPKERVFGTGTTLDTARLRVALAQSLKVSQQNVEAYVLGEHGDSSFAALSGASIGGIPLHAFPGFEPSMVSTIEQDIRDAAYQIIAAKKATYYGIGQVVANIVGAMVCPLPLILPVCSLANGEYGLDDVVIGLPSLVSSEGVRILEGYPLDAGETRKLLHSAAAIRSAMPEL